MNVAEYIASGIIESYVMGMAEEEERLEFERLCAIHPEIAAARDAFEVALEQQIRHGAQNPPQHVRNQLLLKINEEQFLQPVGMQVQNGRLTSIKKPNPARPALYWAAAAAVAVIFCGYLVVRLQTQNNKLQKANLQLQAKYQQADSTLGSLANEQALAQSKSLTVVHLAGDAAPAQAQANIYWDSASAAVYMVVKNLPALPQGKQYQLWAQINGHPTSLGVFDAPGDKVIFKMGNTQKAEAFAITIEPKGGNTAPGGKVQATGRAKGL